MFTLEHAYVWRSDDAYPCLSVGAFRVFKNKPETPAERRGFFASGPTRERLHGGTHENKDDALDGRKTRHSGKGYAVGRGAQAPSAPVVRRIANVRSGGTLRPIATIPFVDLRDPALSR